MSYIVETNTKDDFLENLTPAKKNMFSVTLNQFAGFATNAYDKKNGTVLTDDIKITKQEDNYAKNPFSIPVKSLIF
jgi:hypothetical protein